MPLQQSKSAIISDPLQYSMLLYGEAGVGKTTFAASIPGHYYVSAEAGTAGVSVTGEPITGWERFLEICRELLIAKAAGWEGQRVVTTLVVDTYDKLFEYCADWVVKNESFIDQGKPQKFTKIEDVCWGKGYKRVNQLLTGVLNKMQLMGFGCVLLSHVKEKDIKWRGQPVTTYGPSVPPSGQDAIIDHCDVVGYFSIDETIERGADGQPVSTLERRRVIFQPSFAVRAKHRLQGFPDNFFVPKLPASGWEEYCTLFAEAFKNAGAK